MESNDFDHDIADNQLCAGSPRGKQDTCEVRSYMSLAKHHGGRVGVKENLGGGVKFFWKILLSRGQKNFFKTFYLAKKSKFSVGGA